MCWAKKKPEAVKKSPRLLMFLRALSFNYTKKPLSAAIIQSCKISEANVMIHLRVQDCDPHSFDPESLECPAALP